LDQFQRLGEEIGQRHGSLIAFGAGANAYCLGFGFFVAHDQDVGGFLVGEVADFGIHFLVAIVDFDSQSGGFEFCFDLGGVCMVALADGDEANLDRREPKREGSGVVLDEDAEKTLDRTKKSAVDHHRLMLFSVFADVFKLKSGWQVEVELNG